MSMANAENSVECVKSVDAVDVGDGLNTMLI